LQAPGGVGGDELFQKQPAEQRRKHAHRNLPQPRPPSSLGARLPPEDASVAAASWDLADPLERSTRDAG
jgi:hypothetical protein